jgi:hypothetical protein
MQGRGRRSLALGLLLVIAAGFDAPTDGPVAHRGRDPRGSRPSWQA